MSRPTTTRQRIRRAVLLLSFIAFPITINYFSPYLIVDGAFNGVITGSFVVFGTMLLGSLVFGRLWCGWACPVGGLQEFAAPVNDRAPGPKAKYVKWFIWFPWLFAIAFGALSVGGYRAIDLFYGTAGGISVAAQADRPILIAYIIYFGVIALFLGVAMTVGRRAACHSVCWMAPFMICGRSVRNRFGWPALRPIADEPTCRSCGTCTRECPMGLDVQGLVHSGSMEHVECTLCGTCVDTCPHKTIRYTFSAGK